MLWHLKLTDKVWEDPNWSSCDCYVAMIVRAPGAPVARMIAASKAGDEGARVWINVGLSTCEPIGDRGPNGVILGDYR